MEIRVAGIVNDSVVDGPGIRLTVFTQGCPHLCPGCQNEQTHDFNAGEILEVSKIIELLKANPLLRGITLSGGEPFVQSEACLEIAKAVHDLDMDVWVYTGYLYEEIESGKLGNAACEFLKECDVLVDGPFISELRTFNLRFRGSSNQRIIDVPASLDSGQVVEKVLA